MTPRRRGKTRILMFCAFLIVLVFVLHQVVSNLTAFWLNYSTTMKKELEFDFDTLDFATIHTEEGYIPKSQPFLGEKLVHLDLKGAPPSLSYLKQFIPFVKKLGATGLLMEYEDMFPYMNELEDIKATNAYSLSEIKDILELADANELKVIPLIQTFGHFEFVLKLKGFKDLREVNKYPQVVCPSHKKTNVIIQNMIDQILEAHPKAEYIHIGCDEVFYLGKCERCKSVMTNNNWNPKNLFFNHVKNIATYINRTYSDIRPIIWADMITQTDESLALQYQIPDLVDLMVWKYTPNVPDYITDELLSLYARHFKKVWIASAFKGATGVNQLITNSKYHLKNQISWMKIVSEWKKSIVFKGIALTGWQRYDHFAELCELLPVAIPSLTISLQYLKGSDKETHVNVIRNVLQCDSFTSFSLTAATTTDSMTCNFPGFPVYKLMHKFVSFLLKIEDSYSGITKGWFSIYNVVHRFSNPYYVENIFDRWPVDEFRDKIRIFEDEFKKALSEVYDEHTVEEWVMTRIVSIRIWLDAIYTAKETILEQEYWPQRPLLNGTQLLELAADSICSPGRRFGCGLLLL